MSACAILRRIVRPCRWCQFVEPATAKKAVETAQVNIKCPFHGYPGGLHNASHERFLGKLKDAVTDVHLVVLTAARAVLKTRRVSPSRDVISAGNKLPICTVVYTFHPIFLDTRVASIQPSVSHVKLRINNPRTDPDVRKSRIKEACCSVYQRNPWQPSHDPQSKRAISRRAHRPGLGPPREGHIPRV